jgi:hypothetical protein
MNAHNCFLKLTVPALLVCLVLLATGCGGDKKEHPGESNSAGSAEESQTTANPDSGANQTGQAAMATVKVPPIEERRLLPEVVTGTELEVVSTVPGKLEILSQSDESMGTVEGEKPWIRCMVPGSQNMYKVNFEPAGDSFGTQRIFPLPKGRKKTYIQITPSSKSKNAWIFKQQQEPF